jgi:hypothetical protein
VTTYSINVQTVHSSVQSFDPPKGRPDDPRFAFIKHNKSTQAAFPFEFSRLSSLVPSPPPSPPPPPPPHGVARSRSASSTFAALNILALNTSAPPVGFDLRSCSSLFGTYSANVQHVVAADEGIAVLVLQLPIDILFRLLEAARSARNCESRPGKHSETPKITQRRTHRRGSTAPAPWRCSCSHRDRRAPLCSRRPC